MKADTNLSGSTVRDRYRLEERLGRGGMGEVYRAIDLWQENRPVALKFVLNVDAAWLRLFEQEFSILAAYGHPNIVPVFDFGFDDSRGAPYYTAELIEGSPLSSEGAPWEESELVDLLVEMSRALRFLHGRGILHGDIKPANIIRKPNGTFVLLDFGVAAHKGDITDYVGGTPAFMAPELRAHKTPDDRSDLYSLGATLYRIATGQLPHVKKGSGDADPIPLRTHRSDLSEEFESVIMKLLRPARDARYRSADELLRAVQRILGWEQPIETRETLRAYVARPPWMGREKVLEGAIQYLTSPEKSIQEVVVSGPLGVGKSRLLEEMTTALQIKGTTVTVLRANAGAPNYVTFLREMARPYATAESTEAEEVDPAVVGLYTENMERWLANRIARFPHVLVIEDLDRLDSLEQDEILTPFRRMAALSRSQLRLVWSSEGKGIPKKRKESVRVLRLEPFDATLSGEFLARLIPEIHPSVADAIGERCGGNPLLLTNAARGLIHDPERWQKVESLPEITELRLTEDVSDVYRQRIETLDQTSREIIELLAVSRLPLPRRLLLSELSEGNGATDLFSSGLVRSRIFQGEPCLEMENDAIRSAIGPTLPTENLRGMNLRVADLLLGWQGQQAAPKEVFVEPLARHLLRAGEQKKAAPFFLQALVRDHDLHANAQAATLLAAGREFLEQGVNYEEWSEIAKLAAAVYLRTGDFDQSLDVLGRLIEADDTGDVSLRRRVAEVFLKKGEIRKAVAEAQRILSETPEKKLSGSDEEVRLLCIQQIASEIERKEDEVFRIGKEIDKKSSPATFREKVISMATQSSVWANRKDLDRAEELMKQALSMCEKAKYGPGVSMAHGVLASLSRRRGRREETRKAFARAIEAAEACSDYGAVATHHSNLGRFLKEQGEYGAALTHYERSTDLFRKLGIQREWTRAAYRRALLLLHIEGGKRIGDELRRIIEFAIRIGDPEPLHYARLALARVTGKLLPEDRNALAEHFNRRRDRGGQAELRVVALEIGDREEEDPIDIASFSLEQKIRMIETLFGAPGGNEKITDLLNDELRKECEASSNPEWRAWFLSLRARRANQLGLEQEAAVDAESALKVFEQIGSQLHERLQDAYLTERKYDELRTMAQRSSGLDLPSSDSRTKAYSESTSVRVARHLSSELITRFLDGLKELQRTDVSGELVERLVDHAIALADAERGIFVERDEEDVRVLAARNMAHLWIRSGEAVMSRSLLQEALTSGAPVVKNDIFASSLRDQQTSVVDSGAQAILCVPIPGEGGFRGAFYLDRKRSNDPFGPQQVVVLQALAEHGALLLERERMAKDLSLQSERIQFLNRQLELTIEKLRIALDQKEKELVTAQGLLDVSKREEELAEGFREIIGRSEKLTKVLEVVDHAAQSGATVCIQGETGTGKELVARALHARSPRKSEIFLPVTCSAIPPDLFESFFFGHEKGAFTGATTARAGYFVLANNGTLFLDEISALSLEMQAKLLRAVETSTVSPVGSTREVTVSVRIVVATNRDLEEDVRAGTFREDLYFRLCVIRIDVPPLRERPEDIPVLVEHFVNQSATTHGVRPPIVSDRVLEIFLRHAWPGNVRQLRNEIDRVVSLLPQGGGEGLRVDEAHLSPSFFRKESTSSPRTAEPEIGSLDEALDQLTEGVVRRALEKTDGSQRKTAKLLKISRNRLARILKKLNIESTSE